jgi:chaperone modulatory protein CbpM
MSREEHVLMQILDEYTEVAFADLVAASGFERDLLVELIDYGVFQPRGQREENWRFPSHALALARRAARLRSSFELDIPALALALELLDRMEALEQRVRELECQLLRP